MCFLHGMRMCMWIAHNCWISFCHFLDIVNLVIFHPEYIDSGCLLWVQLLLHFWNFVYWKHLILWHVFYTNLWKFADVFMQKWEYPYAFNEIPTFISSTWNNHYLFVGMGVEWGAGATPLSAEFWWKCFLSSKQKVNKTVLSSRIGKKCSITKKALCPPLQFLCRFKFSMMLWWILYMIFSVLGAPANMSFWK